jgi:hypothetical protein
MNNEPYGWVKNGEYVLYIEKPDSVFNYIPLYTHQYERPHNTVLVPCDKLAEMQAEIEALKQIIDANNLSQNIGQFVKPTNEPVAWMHQNPDYAISKHQSLEFNIPLYTHPVKELTDEEILKMAADKFHYSEYRLVIEFARTILRKAQEK